MRNADETHNEPVTARPRIFFPAKLKERSLATTILGVTHQRREFTPAYFQLGSEENKELLASVSEEDRATFKALLALRGASSADEPLAKKHIEAATRLLMPKYPESANAVRGVDARKLGRRLYPAVLEETIRRARVIIQRDFAPAIYCPNLSTAMFTFAAYKGVSVCLNCQTIFAVDVPRPDGYRSDKYCSSACPSRYRQKVYRANQKKRATKSKRKERRK
jgi:hypothetical protein